MAFTIAPKAKSDHSNVPSRVETRQTVSMGQPSPTTAKLQALKAKLQSPSQPAVPRPTGSSLRAEQMKQLSKFNSPQVQTSKPIGSTDARQEIQDFSKIAPPPIAEQSIDQLRQTPNNVEIPLKAPEANSEPLSPQFVALARKEKQLRKAQQEFKAQQEAWKQEQEKYISKDRLSSETLKVLSEAGITSDKLVELQINQSTPKDPNQVFLDKIAELEKKLQDFTDPENGEFARRDKQQYDQVLTQIRSDVKLLVDSNPSFGTIKSEGKTEDVVSLITRVFDEEGIVLDVEEAADLIENKLTDKLVKDYERLSKYEKIKAKLGKSEAKETEASSGQQSPQPTQTLTNNKASTRPLTPRERAILKVQEAREALKRK